MKQSPVILYSDAMTLLDEALRNGRGVKYDTGDKGRARYIAQRCNKARLLMRKGDPDGLSPYDAFIVKCEGTMVVIVRRPEIDIGKVIPLC